VLFGIGGGWNLEEMENHGTKPSPRWKVLRERVLAMKKIWAEDEAEFHGEFVNFDPIWSWPKPVQKPHPPIVIGGDGPRTLDRVVEYGDEWMPIAGRSGNALEARIGELQAKAKAAGRGPIPVSLFAAPPRAEMLGPLEEAGVTRAVFVLPPVPSEDALSRLKRYAEARDAYQRG
jgi:alkanesulfonate monooxygenase SsuD/methylene tetrahydromethanopterin reductase-like flavin-dependent oxidoreductase (luciferase family)